MIYGDDFKSLPEVSTMSTSLGRVADNLLKGTSLPGRRKILLHAVGVSERPFWLESRHTLMSGMGRNLPSRLMAAMGRKQTPG